MDDATRRAMAAMKAMKLTKLGLPSVPQTTPPPAPPEQEAVVVDGVKGTKKVKLSKKRDLSKLPKTWRSQVFKQLRPDKQSRLASAVALLWATGCRPVEIEKGVQVKLENGVLVVEIRGAKTGSIPVMTPRDADGLSEITQADRGLEWRRLKLNPKLNAATEYLARLCADGQSHQVSYNKNSLRTRLNETGKLAISKMPEDVTVSPYTFRHAMGSDVKSCDTLTDEERSQIMGHLSMDSLSVYGRKRHSGGVSPVASVEASAEPRGEYTDSPKTAKRGHKPR